MTSPNWLRKVFASQAALDPAGRDNVGRRARSRKAPRPAARPVAGHGLSRPLIEQLEDRTLLSAATQTFAAGSVTQFTNQSNTTFLGASFNPSASFGSIKSTVVGDFGAQVNVSLAGKAGLNLTFTGTKGTVTPSYKATLNQDFTQPSRFGEVVSFNPQNTNVIFNSGSFSTTSPAFGYAADLVAELSGSLGGQFAFFKDFGGSFSFDGGLDIPLFSLNKNADGLLTVGGLPIVGASPGLGLPALAQQIVGGAEDFALSKALVFGISEDPPLRLKLGLSAKDLQFSQDLQLQLGVPKQLGPYAVPQKLQGFTANASMDLGSLTEQAPAINLNSGPLQAGGVLTAAGSDAVAQLNLQAGALAGSLLGLGVLGTTDTIKIGPASVQFTPVSFLLQPNLSADQTVTLEPVSLLTYKFTDSGGKAATPDVTLNGVDQGHVSSVTFVPGQDTVGIAFTGNPITVTPSWEFKEVLTNEVDLDANLDATLTVGQITVSVPGLDPITAGPLYQQQFHFAGGKLMTLFDQTSTVLDRTVTSNANDLSTPQSFVIGAGFKASTVVNTLSDNDAPDQKNTDANGVPLNNSLRDAVIEANSLSSPTIIHLGGTAANPSVYTLTLSPNGKVDGTGGNLLVLTGKDVTIQGNGPGATIIQGDFPAAQFDRLFCVQSGAKLTLNGLTIEDGDPLASDVARGDGGAVFQDTGSTLDVENCVITDNQAVAGGGIYCSDTTDHDHFSIAATPLTINNSTISNNAAVGQDSSTDNTGNGLTGGAGLGGGVYLGLTGVGARAVIENTTFSGNSAVGGAGGDGGDSFSTPGDGGNGGNGEGGGLYVKQTIFINTAGVFNGNNCYLVNDTFSANFATGGAGGRGGLGVTAFGKGGDGGDGLGAAVRINEVPDDSGAKGYPDVLLNDTIAGNVAGGGRGGVAVLVVGSNGSGLGGGAYTEPGYSLEAQNTILAKNAADQGPDMDGKISSGGTNLIGNTSGVTLAPAQGAPADLTNVDPKLGAPANNGGPTRTMAIAPGSPAYHAGQGTALAGLFFVPPFPATDQRGFPRAVGGKVDIGAFQYQYDLAVSGVLDFKGSAKTVAYALTVINNGPDAPNGVKVTDTLPAFNSFAAGLPPSGWTLTRSGSTLTITDANPLGAGQSATFHFTLDPAYAPPVAVVDTATVTPSADDNTPANNSATLTILNPIEGQALSNVLLLHFTPPAGLTAADYTASVQWDDGSAVNTTGDGTGTVSLVANPNGGVDVFGTHAFTDENAGNGIGVDVTSAASPISFGGGPVYVVADAPLTGGAVTPPPVLLQQQFNQTVLYHFDDPNDKLVASDFTASVQWGDGTSNTSGDGSGKVIVKADAGGFDVLGTYSYAANVVGAMRSVRVKDSDGRVFYNPVLFHLTDGNPNATASDFTATVNWGDGGSNTSADGSGSVAVVPSPAGGFDVVGSHVYAQSTRNGTFSVSVADDGGASTSNSAPFSVDSPLTAGKLTLPAVTNEGDAISKALLFHFTDGDAQGQASDFTATVLWGDGASNTSADGTGTVSVAANSNGGFDVYGSHTFGDVAGGGDSGVVTFGVHVQDVSGADTGASSTTFAVADPSVRATGGFGFTATENADPGAQTVATFTDPAGAEALDEYAASIRWGDGTADSGGTISYDSTSKTFTVKADHVYSQAGSDAITVTISHDQSAAVSVTDKATVAEVAVSLSGSFQGTMVYGQSTGTQTGVTFTDAGGAGPLAGYQPTIDWGDGHTTSGTVGFDKAAPFTFASNLQTGNGPSAAAVADLDGDGHLDLVVANAADGSVQVFLGNGDGSFQAPATYFLGASPAALAIADLGNGQFDIVTANTNNNTVSVLLGNGGGTFQKPTALAAGTSPGAVALADLGNGHVDIVVANQGSNNVSVFLGNGDGTFKAAVTYAAGTDPVGVAVGDLNGDGKSDLVVADAGTASVAVLLGTGPGTFGAPTTVAVGSVPSAVALGHLTSSGHLDIVTANSGDNNVSVLLGKGDGTFQKAVNYAVGTAPVALLLTDADGDGNLDVITANNGSNNVSVLAGQGDGTFGAATNYALAGGATAPVSLAVGDLDGAGVPDLVTADSLSNNVTLLLPPYTVTASHTYAAVSGANPYAVKVSVAHGGTSASSTGSATVTPAPLTITADDKSMTYGDTLPTLTATFTGLVNGDTSDAVRGLKLSTVSASSHVGSYTITAGGATDSNYTITLVNGTLTISAAPLTIAADDKSRPYGDPNPTLTATYTGLVNGDTPASLTGTLSLGTSATQASPAGSYTISAGGQSSNDYTITYQAGTLTINQTMLTVTANDASRIYGVANPTFTASYSGFKNGETLATSGVTGSPSLTTTATAASPVGSYAIAAATGTLAAANYGFSFAAGTLTVTPAPLTATGLNVSATAGAPFNGAVATFLNADPFGGASSYTAVITWGDGSTSAGTISGTGSTLTVSGSHTYAGAGSDPVSVQIGHKLGYTTTATTGATATVTNLGVGVQKGQAAGIGFWQSNNGQALIQSFNGGAGSTALGNWLAATFANLYGGLAGKTNAQVAAFYLTQFNLAGAKLGAEVLATALNVYATTSSLGGTAAQAYGFKVDAYGLGASSYNVGGNGAAFGVANNTVLNVYQLLQLANARAANGAMYGGDATLIALAVNVFDGINSAGGI